MTKLCFKSIRIVGLLVAPFTISLSAQAGGLVATSPYVPNNPVVTSTQSAAYDLSRMENPTLAEIQKVPSMPVRNITPAGEHPVANVQIEKLTSDRRDRRVRRIVEPVTVKLRTGRGTYTSRCVIGNPVILSDAIEFRSNMNVINTDPTNGKIRFVKIAKGCKSW